MYAICENCNHKFHVRKEGVAGRQCSKCRSTKLSYQDLQNVVTVHKEIDISEFFPKPPTPPKEEPTEKQAPPIIIMQQGRTIDTKGMTTAEKLDYLSEIAFNEILVEKIKQQMLSDPAGYVKTRFAAEIMDMYRSRNGKSGF